MEHGDQRSTQYDAGRERAYHASILIGQGVSACAVHDLTTAEPHALLWAANAAVLHHRDLPKHPRSVTFVSLPEWSTLVPDGALQPETGARHLALVHGSTHGGQVRDEPVQTLGATCLYVNDDAHDRMVLERFPNARALPLQAVLVRGAQLRATSGSTVLVHRGAERVDIAVAQGQRVLLSNSYPARTAEDLLYFCLLATEQCGLRSDTVGLRTGGTHLAEKERDLLGRYFGDHASAIQPEWPGMPSSAGQPLDRWLAALDQFACVS